MMWAEFALLFAKHDKGQAPVGFYLMCLPVSKSLSLSLSHTHTHTHTRTRTRTRTPSKPNKEIQGLLYLTRKDTTPKCILKWDR